MKKGRFLWSAHRITEKPKAGKARNIKEKQLKNSRNTASKQPVALPSSPRDNYTIIVLQSTFQPEGALFYIHIGSPPPKQALEAFLRSR